MDVLPVHRNQMQVSTWNSRCHQRSIEGRKPLSTSKSPFKVFIERVILSVLPCVWIDVSIVSSRNGPSVTAVESRAPKHVVNDFAIGHSRFSNLIEF